MNTAEQALRAIERLQARVHLLETAQAAPIAVVGAACQLPGGASTQSRRCGVLCWPEKTPWCRLRSAGPKPMGPCALACSTISANLIRPSLALAPEKLP